MEEDDKSARLEKKIDDLTDKVNRLSGNFDNYAHTQAQYGHDGGPIANGNQVQEVDDHDDYTTDFSKDENEDRGNWSGRLDFLLACLGYAVGLGNVWRFPYLCYKNGGAVFFIPYVIMLFFVGIPIFMLELSLGQFTSLGPLSCWECARIFKGIGVGMCIVSFIVSIYYNMIIAWAIYYFFASFTRLPDLPWDFCDYDFNTPFCSLNLASDAVNCTQLGYNASWDGVCYTNNDTVYGIWDLELAKNNSIRPVLPTEEYLNRKVIGKDLSPGIEDLGPLRWDLLLCLLFAWVIVCLSLIKGIKSSGKVVYFTALFPYCVLVILLIRGVMLDGHMEGIEFYIMKVKFEKLAEAAVWKDAAVQIFFSLSASWGGLIALSSYNRFHNDCLRDTLIVSVGNCLTSVFAGFVIFSYLGYLAKQQGVDVEDVVESGVGLAFIVYPAAVSTIQGAPFWAILFFLMLITLGLDSEFAMVETVCTSIMDQFPQTRKRKWAVILCVSIFSFLLGLTLCTNGGAYLLQLMDTYSGGWNLLLISLAECICIAYVYGFSRYSNDVKLMIGKNGCGCIPWDCINKWWAICWFFFTPAGVLFILIFSWYDYSPATYDDYTYPVWGDALGWMMTMVVIVGLIGTAIVLIIIQICKGEPIGDLFRPTDYWGPALVKHRKLQIKYLAPEDFVVDPWNQEPIELSDIKAGIGSENPSYAGEKF